MACQRFAYKCLFRARRRVGKMSTAAMFDRNSSAINVKLIKTPD